MPVDMKELIAGAAVAVLTKKDIKKLTVKNIVEECQITRQAFYYHFEDIPHLFCWMMEKGSERVMESVMQEADPEKGLRCFFLMSINSMPYVKKGMETNYRKELEQLLTQQIYSFFEQVIEQQDLYQSRTRQEIKLILRYHCQAVLGILSQWTDEDTKNLDQIVHLVYLLMTEGISPHI